MQTNRKKIGISLIVLGLVLLLAIIYFQFFRPKAIVPTETNNIPETTTTLPTEPETGTTTPSDKVRNYQQYDISQEPAHKTDATDLEKRAMAYAARLGSYSSYSNYSNFDDLKMYMTEELRTWVVKYIEELKNQAKGKAYYGIMTDSLLTEVKSFDDKAGTADIIVTTERRVSTEKIGGGEPYIQKIELNFVKVNNDWLMNKSYWQ
jgi:hypothetical protein